MAVNVRPLKPTPNDVLMDHVRNSLSLDYQNRIPSATQAGVREASKALMSYRPAANEFLDALVNHIGMIQVRNTLWTNPLWEFKKGLIEHGDTIEEVKVGMIRAHNYDPDREHLEADIFGTERPDVRTNFHRVNRRDFYKISVSEALLRGAFLSTNGIQEFISELMNAPATSDAWDEFVLMCSLIPQYEENGGFYHVHVPDSRAISASGQEAREVTKRVRAMAQNLSFMSTRYNAAGMPSHVKEEDLVLFGTPEFFATQDVESLAAAFNMDRATLAGRQIAIPKEHFGIEGAQAILTSKDWFVVGDYILENTAADNPVGLHRNYFLHHHQIISQSRFVPAVMFWTGADDEVITVSEPVTGITAVTVTDRAGETVTEVERGGIYVASAEATGAEGKDVNTTVRYRLTGQDDATRTRITQQGTVHVSPRESAESLTVTATSVWVDPEDPQNTDVKVATTSLTVSGERLPEWPIDHEHAPRDADDPATVEWAATTAYAEGDSVTLSGGQVLTVATAGTSGDTEPKGGRMGGSVEDGTVVWERTA